MNVSFLVTHSNLKDSDLRLILSDAIFRDSIQLRRLLNYFDLLFSGYFI